MVSLFTARLTCEHAARKYITDPAIKSSPKELLQAKYKACGNLPGGTVHKIDLQVLEQLTTNSSITTPLEIHNMFLY